MKGNTEPGAFHPKDELKDVLVGFVSFCFPGNTQLNSHLSFKQLDADQNQSSFGLQYCKQLLLNFSSNSVETRGHWIQAKSRSIAQIYIIHICSSGSVPLKLFRRVLEHAHKWSGRGVVKSFSMVWSSTRTPSQGIILKTLLTCDISPQTCTFLY